MSSPEEPTIKTLAEAMYAECRANVGLYDSPSGIRVPPLDNPEYSVTYWPAWTDDDGSHPERLTISLGAMGEPGTVYHVKPDDGITVNRAENARRLGEKPGSGVMYSGEDDRPLENVTEATLVLGLIRAAHNQRRITGI